MMRCGCGQRPWTLHEEFSHEWTVYCVDLSTFFKNRNVFKLIKLIVGWIEWSRIESWLGTLCCVVFSFTKTKWRQKNVIMILSKNLSTAGDVLISFAFRKHKNDRIILLRIINKIDTLSLVCLFYSIFSLANSGSTTFGLRWLLAVGSTEHRFLLSNRWACAAKLSNEVFLHSRRPRYGFRLSDFDFFRSCFQCEQTFQPTHLI